MLLVLFILHLVFYSFFTYFENKNKVEDSCCVLKKEKQLEILIF